MPRQNISTFEAYPSFANPVLPDREPESLHGVESPGSPQRNSAAADSSNGAAFQEHTAIPQSASRPIEVKRRPHPLPDGSACVALRTASRAVTQLYDLVLAPTGLKATQFSILHAIHEAGEVAQCDFAREHAIAVPTLSRRFGGLRRKNYIQIRTGTRHGEHIYSLTAKGAEAFEKALPYWERAQHRLRTALGESDWHMLFDLSERVRLAALDAEQLRTGNQLRPVLASSRDNGSDGFDA